MKQDEIIEMAKPFLWGGNVVESWTFSSYKQLETFAKLVAEKEREACAKIIQTHLDANDDLRAKGSLASVLDYIRARGKQA